MKILDERLLAKGQMVTCCIRMHEADKKLLTELGAGKMTKGLRMVLDATRSQVERELLDYQNQSKKNKKAS